MKKIILDGCEYSIKECRNYLILEDLFTASGLEFNLDESGLQPEGFVKAFCVCNESHELIAASSIAYRKGCFILHDIAVSEAFRGLKLGEKLLEFTICEIEKLGGNLIYITAKVPKFFEKYGFEYLEESEVPDIFGCLKCKQLNISCMPEFMRKRLEAGSNSKQKTKMSTLCYIERDDKYLMLHRVFKENDVNKGKWIGVGGHFEFAESPEECLCREVFEETGYVISDYKFRGLITFVYGEKEIVEYMHLFTARNVKGEHKNCDEGILEWIPKKDIFELDLWEGDRIFLRLLDERDDFFSLKLVYNDKDELIESKLDGEYI